MQIPAPFSDYDALVGSLGLSVPTSVLTELSGTVSFISGLSVLFCGFNLSILVLVQKSSKGKG